MRQLPTKMFQTQNEDAFSMSTRNPMPLQARLCSRKEATQKSAQQNQWVLHHILFHQVLPPAQQMSSTCHGRHPGITPHHLNDTWVALCKNARIGTILQGRGLSTTIANRLGPHVGYMPQITYWQGRANGAVCHASRLTERRLNLEQGLQQLVTAISI